MANIDLYMGKLTNIANAIRTKLNEQDTYLLEEMPAKILSIPTGGGASLSEYKISFPAYTYNSAYGGAGVHELYPIPDELIESKKYNRLKLQAFYKCNFSNTQTKTFELIMSIIFYKEPVWDSSTSAPRVDALYYKLSSNGTWTKTAISIPCTNMNKTYTHDGKTIRMYTCNPGMGASYSTTYTNAMNYNRWTVSTSGAYTYQINALYGNIKDIYEDAITSGYDILSNIDGISGPDGFLYNGEYYRPIVYMYNNNRYQILRDSINCYLYISRSASSTSGSDAYGITPVTNPSGSTDYEVLKAIELDNINGDYNIKLYNVA